MKRFLIILILGIGFVAGQAQNIVYVRVNGTGNGSSWANSTSLTNALKQATSGDQLWLEKGVYASDSSFLIGDGVNVYGGFTAVETALSQRNYDQNESILDGRSLHQVVRMGALSLLDGVTVRNGFCARLEKGSGGGIYMGLGAKVYHCKIENNKALYYGGGIYAQGDGVVFGCLVKANFAGMDGIGIYGGNLSVRNSTVVSNRLWNCGFNMSARDTLRICLGDSAILKVGAKGFYQWSTGESSESIVVKPSATQTYRVVYMDMGQVCAFYKEYVVILKAGVNVSVSVSPTIANVNTLCRFTAVGSPSGGIYQWNDPNQNSGSVLEVLMPDTGNLEYQCTYSLDACSAQGLGVISNTKCTPPVVAISLGKSIDSVCSATDVQLYITGGQRNSGKWYLYSGSCGGLALDNTSTNSFKVRPLSSTTYYVRGEGCGLQTACVSASVHVNPLPLSITGATSMCQYASEQLLGLPSGGRWLSDIQGNVSVDTLGLVQAYSAGEAVVRYILPTNCYKEHTIKILSSAEKLDGPDAFCAGSEVQYKGFPLGGSYRLETNAYARIDAFTGVLSSDAGLVSEQKLLLYYSHPANACEIKRELTLYQNPLKIQGLSTVCVGDTLLLRNSTLPSGIWQSNNSLVADFVNSSSGQLVGRNAGSTQVYYFLGACFDTLTVKVNPLPSKPLLGVFLCSGSQASVSVSELNKGGRFRVSPSTVAKVDSIDNKTALLSGLTHGRFSLSYTLPSGCKSVLEDSVYVKPFPITGPSDLGLGRIDTLKSSPTGGFWTSSDNTIVSVQGLGVSCAIMGQGQGVADIRYTMSGSGCNAHKQVSTSLCAHLNFQAASNKDQSLCAGSSLTPIYFSVTSSRKLSIIWTDDLGNTIAMPTGILLDTTRAIKSISGNISPAGVYTYKIETLDHLSNCPSASIGGRIVIYPALSGGKIGLSQRICQGSTPNAFSNVVLASGGAPGGSYQWQRASLSEGIWQDMAGAINQDYDDISYLTESQQYRRVYKNACGTVYSDTILVQVDSFPQIIAVNIDSNSSCGSGNGEIRFSVKNPSHISYSKDGVVYQNEAVFDNLLTGSYTIYAWDTIRGCKSSQVVEVPASSGSVPLLVVEGKDSICQGWQTTWQAKIQNDDGGVYDYQWSRSNTSLGSDPSLIVSTAGSYSVKVTHSTTSCYSVITKSLRLSSPVLISSFSPVQDTTICVDDLIRFKVSASSASPMDIVWYRAEDIGFTQDLAEVAISSEMNYSPPVARSRYYKAVVSPRDGICPSVSTSVIQLTAEARPKAIILGPSAVCMGDSATLSMIVKAGWTYAWVYGTDTISRAASLKVLPVGQENIYRLITHNGYCSADTMHKIEMRLRPTFGYADAHSGNVVQTVCHNGTIQSIRGKVENASSVAIGWENDKAAQGLVFDPGSKSLSGTVSDVAGIYPYWVYTVGQALECSADTAKGAITILAPVEGGSISSAVQYVCFGSVPPAFISNRLGSGGALSGTSYQWQDSVVGGRWTDLVGATEAEGGLSDPINKKHYYRRAYKNACSIAYSNIVSVDVHPLPVEPTLSASDNSSCGSTPNGKIQVTAPTGANYQYRIQGSSTWVNIAEFNNLSGSSYRVHIKDNTTGCENMSSVTVHNSSTSNIPDFSIISNLPGGNDSVCTDATDVELLADLHSNCEGASYKWYALPDLTNPISINSTANISPSVNTIYRLQIINRGACTGTQEREITLINPITITSHPKNDTACGTIGQMILSVAANTGGSSVVYQWQSSSLAQDPWQNVGSNSSQYIIQNNTDIEASIYYRCLVRYQHTAVCSPAVSHSGHIKIVKLPLPVISGDLEICGGVSARLSVPDIYKKYQWSVNGNPIGGANTASVEVFPLSTTQVYRIDVDNGYCGGSAMATLKAFESPSIVPPVPAEPNLCINSPITTRKIIAYNATDLSIQWKRNGLSVGANPDGLKFSKISQGKNASGIDSCLYHISGTPQITGSYTYTLTSEGHASICSSVNYNGSFIVNTALNGGEIAAVESQICYQTTPSAFLNVRDASGGYGSTQTYQWYAQNGASFDVINGATAPTFNESTSLTSARSYKREYKNSCGSVFSNTISINVKAFDPAPTVVVEGQTSCLGPNGHIRITAPQGNQYEFSINGGSDYQADSVFSQLSTSHTYQVLAMEVLSKCMTAVKEVNIPDLIYANKPLVSIRVYPKDSVCSDANDIGLKALVSNAGQNPLYTWSHAMPNADSVTDKPINNTTYTLNVKNTETGCDGASMASKTVYVFPAISIVKQPIGGSVCVDSNSNHTLSVHANATGLPRDYQWQRSLNGTQGSFSDISGATFMDYDVPTNVPSDYYYRCLVSGGFGICALVSSDVVRFNVLAKPQIPVISPADSYICEGSSLSLTTSAPTSGSTLFWSTGETTNSINVSPSANISEENAPTSYYLSLSNGVCSVSSSAVVRVSRKHVINHIGDAALSLHDQRLCQGIEIVDILHSFSGGVSQSASPVFSWKNPKGGNSAPAGTSTIFSGGTLSVSGTLSASADTGIYQWELYTLANAGNVCPADTTRGSILVGLVPGASFIYGQVSGTSTACTDTTLTATGGEGGSFYWQTSAMGSSILSPGNNLLVNSSNNYYVRAMSAHGCWGKNAARTLTILKGPTILAHPSIEDRTIIMGNFPSLSVSAAGQNLKYQWYRNSLPNNNGGDLVVGANSATYIPDNSIPGSVYYYCVVSSECSITTLLSGKHTTSCTYPTLVMNENLRYQTVTDNCAPIKTITHTLSGNSATPTISWTGPNGGIISPAGIAGTSWNSISGKPTASAIKGIYTWTISAKNLACITQSTGTIEVIGYPSRPDYVGGGSPLWRDACTANALNFTGPGTASFVNDSIWKIPANNGGPEQYWTAPVVATGCNKTDYTVPTAVANCRTNCAYEYGDLFSWCAVAAYEDILCPFPWRVPAKEDFINLDKAMGGTGVNRGNGSIGGLSTQEQIDNWYLGIWGGDYGGRLSTSGAFQYQGLYADYWTKEIGTTGSATELSFFSNSIYPALNASVRYGYAIRCIRTPLQILTHPSSTDQEITRGDFPVLKVEAVGNPPLSYQWYSNTSPSNTGATLISGATTASHTPSNLEVGPLYYYCVVSDNSGSLVSDISGAQRFTCTYPTLTMIRGKRSDTLRKEFCGTIITHIQAGGTSGSITWSDPNGGTTPPAGMTATSWNSITGNVSNTAIEGVYTWTVSMRKLACVTTSTGTIKVVAPHPVLSPNVEKIIDGKIYVADHEGNTYGATQIGTQIWLTENMRCKSSPKGIVWDRAAFQYSPYYFVPKDSTCFGVLYNWTAANDTNSTEYPVLINFPEKNRGICPKNWHIPSIAEWDTLVKKYPLASQWAANSSLWTVWTTVNAPGNYANNTNQNESGMSVFPAGNYNTYQYNPPANMGIGNQIHLWSARESSDHHSYAFYLSYTSENVQRSSSVSKRQGNYLRCIRSVCDTIKLEMTEGKRLDTLTQGTCLPMRAIQHTVSGTSNSPSITWTGPADGTSAPNGISFSGNRISGTPSASAIPGTYTWTIRVSAPVSGESCTQSSSGTIFVKTPPNRAPYAGGASPVWADACTANASGFNGVGTAKFVNNEINHIPAANGVIEQWWSSPVEASGCNKTTMNSLGNTADCRSNCEYDLGDLFSWCALRSYADTLCPFPWRVPSKDDFINLDKAMGGTGMNRSSGDIGGLNVKQQIDNWYLDTWGGAYGGSSNNTGALSHHGSHANYWSSEQLTVGNSFSLNLISNGGIHPQTGNSKESGFALRCVREIDPVCDQLKFEMTGGKRNDTLIQGSCFSMMPITHTKSGPGAPPILTWSGHTGNIPPAGITSKWNSIRGEASDATELGTYGWDISVSATISGVNCSKTSSGTIKVVAAEPVPVLPPNTEATIDGKLYVSDHEGNVYSTTQIGTQIWLAENMRCKSSPKGIAWTEKREGETHTYAPYYFIPPTACFGVLYNWIAANDTNSTEAPVQITLPEKNRGICPENWHIPSISEWDILAEKYPFASQWAACSYLWTASTATNSPGNYANNTNQNESGMSAFPAGYYTTTRYMTVRNIYLWSATDYSSSSAYRRTIRYEGARVERDSFSKKDGFSVRCVRD